MNEGFAEAVRKRKPGIDLEVVVADAHSPPPKPVARQRFRAKDDGTLEEYDLNEWPSPIPEEQGKAEFRIYYMPGTERSVTSGWKWSLFYEGQRVAWGEWYYESHSHKSYDRQQWRKVAKQRAIAAARNVARAIAEGDVRFSIFENGDRIEVLEDL